MKLGFRLQSSSVKGQKESALWEGAAVQPGRDGGGRWGPGTIQALEDFRN